VGFLIWNEYSSALSSFFVLLEKNYFAAEKKNLQILINLPEFSAVPIDIFNITQILVEDK